jgi:hypothetical protein
LQAEARRTWVRNGPSFIENYDPVSFGVDTVESVSHLFLGFSGFVVNNDSVPAIFGVVVVESATETTRKVADSPSACRSEHRIVTFIIKDSNIIMLAQR